MLIGVVFVLPVGFVLGMALGFDPDNPEGAGPTLEGVEWIRLALLGFVIVLPFLLGVYFGGRALRSGDRRGWVGLVINGLAGLALLSAAVGEPIVSSVTFTPDTEVDVTATVGEPVAGVSYIGVADSRYGEILVDEAGNTLYTDEFESQPWKGQLVGSVDREDREVWIPAVSTPSVRVNKKIDPAMVGAIKRADDGVQLTYYGHALYTYKGDDPGRFVPFTVRWSEEAGGGPRWKDRHVVTPDGQLLPKLSTDGS